MGKPKIFAIQLHGNNSVYLAGSTIRGNVLLELSEPKVTRSISIMFSGKACTHCYGWTTEPRSSYSSFDSGGFGGERQRRRRLFSSTENVCKNVLIQLCGGGTGHPHELAAGRYEFPFQFQVPLTASSFASSNGYIRYELLARILEESQKSYDVTTAINVNEIVTINTAQLTRPLLCSGEKTLSCLCYTSGTISVTVKTDKGGYCLGESIALHTTTVNHSNRRITHIQATLIQVVVCYAEGHRSRIDTAIKRIEGPGIEPGGTSNWINERLCIPATVPTINSCRILKLSYVLTVAVSIRHATDLHVSMPITIGNYKVPSRGRTNTFSVSQNLPSAPPCPYPTTNPHPAIGGPIENINCSTTHPPVSIRLNDHATERDDMTDQFDPPPPYDETIL